MWQPSIVVVVVVVVVVVGEMDSLFSRTVCKVNTLEPKRFAYHNDSSKAMVNYKIMKHVTV